MADFLTLTKRVARESGTADPRALTSVEAPGRPGRLASLVRDSWLSIQNRHDRWRFLRVPLPGDAVLGVGVNAFTPATFGITDWNEWLLGGLEDDPPLTVWPAGDNDAQRGLERALTILPFGVFTRRFHVGAERARTGRPDWVTVDQQDRLLVHPTPDADYRIAGAYRRVPQLLETNADTPDDLIAEGYQDAIMWKAESLVDEVDEADANVIILARARADGYRMPRRTERQERAGGARAALTARGGGSGPAVESTCVCAPREAGGGSASGVARGATDASRQTDEAPIATADSVTAACRCPGAAPASSSAPGTRPSATCQCAPSA